MKKSEIYAYIGTFISVIIILLMLFMIVLPGIQTEEEAGVMISFGEVTDGSGDGLEASSEEIPQESVPEEEQDLLTQKDPSVVIPETTKKPEPTKKPQVKPEVSTQPKKPAEPSKEELLKKEQQASQHADDLISGSFGSGSKAGTGNSNTTATAGNPIGKGSLGGNSWSLTGRNIVGNMVLPKYTENESGIVVVEITVNMNGVVESAKITRGTNISNTVLRNAAIEAAYKTRFSAGTGKVIGKITYEFKLN